MAICWYADLQVISLGVICQNSVFAMCMYRRSHIDSRRVRSLKHRESASKHIHTVTRWIFVLACPSCVSGNGFLVVRTILTSDSILSMIVMALWDHFHTSTHTNKTVLASLHDFFYLLLNFNIYKNSDTQTIDHLSTETKLWLYWAISMKDCVQMATWDITLVSSVPVRAMYRWLLSPILLTSADLFLWSFSKTSASSQFRTPLRLRLRSSYITSDLGYR